MKDITFIIPYQRDSIDRLNNVNFIIEYLRSIGANHILVSCTNKESTDIKDADILINETSEFNYKTLLINNAILASKTRYICVNDCDVLAKKEDYLKSIRMLRNGFELVIPYEVSMFNIPKMELKYNLENLEFREDYPVLWNKSIGGLYFARKEKFLSIGAENETMIGWGYEDFERNERARRFFLKISYSKFNLWHVEHIRHIENTLEGINAKINLEIYQKVSIMKFNLLSEYITQWIKRWY